MVDRLIRPRSKLSPQLRLNILILSLGMLLLPSTAVQAHANLVRSDPENGSVLPEAPQTASLEFSESLDGGLSRAKLTDSNFQVLAEGPGRIDPNSDLILLLDLPALSPGAYSIVWEARSAVDGHFTNGVVSFSIGSGTSPASFLPSPDTPDPTSAWPSLVDTLLRWSGYISVALACGSILFGILVWRPAHLAWGEPEPASDLNAVRLLRRLSLAGILSLICLSFLFVLFQAWQASHGVFQVPIGSAFLGLIEPRNGWVFWLRIILLGTLAIPGSWVFQPGKSFSASGLIDIFLVLGVLLTFSLQSHTAALGEPLPVLLDWFHITAMATWLGGLLPLFLLLRRSQLPARLLVPRFSRVALISVAVLIASGLYSAFLHIRTLDALTGTLYGQALGVKSLLFGLAVGIAALNLLVLSPRLQGPGEKVIRWLRSNIRIELAVGLSILAAVGLMSGIPVNTGRRVRSWISGWLLPGSAKTRLPST
jgi:copper transport protein